MSHLNTVQECYQAFSPLAKPQPADSQGMKSHTHWMTTITVAGTLSFCGNAFAQNKEGAPKNNPEPVRPSTNDAATFGIPNQAKAGNLPLLTSGLAERAARAFGQKKWDEARAAYEEMLKLEPDNALVLANLGTVEQNSGRTTEAKRCYTRAVTLNPALTQTWLALGLMCNEAGDSYQAVSALTRAIHEEPTDPRGHNYLAVAVKKLGWLDAAEAELQRAIELNPSYANAHFNLALMYLDRKPPAIELAKRHYEKAVALGAEKDEIVEEKLKGK